MFYVLFADYTHNIRAKCWEMACFSLIKDYTLEEKNSVENNCNIRIHENSLTYIQL